MAANLKLGVDLTSFKQGINDAKAQLKSFDAQIKFAETSFKKTGDAEAAMSTKTDALTNKLKTQKQMIQQYDKTLQALRQSGIDPASESYQKMQAAMLNVQSAANETEIALNGLSTSQLTAASSADKLTQSVNGIGKKISLDQVISGIDKITGGLENAAKKAAQVGQSIWNNILDSARLADDTGTAAMLLDMDVEEYQKYKGVFDTIAEMTVTDWMNAKRKVQKAIYDPSKDQSTILAALGIDTHGTAASKYGVIQTAAKEWEDVFWEAATQLRQKVENGEISQDMADTYAEALFGKKAAQLKPLIDLGRDAFTAALGEQNVASKEAIEKDAKLADTVTKLTASYESLKMELTSGFAPALTTLAESLDSLLGRFLKYLQTDEGKQMMESLGASLEELFSGIKNINPEEVVQKFVNVFDDIVGGLKWIIKNKDAVVRALEGVVVGWAGLKLTGGALQILQLVNGVKSFQGVPTDTPQNVTGGNGDVIATGNGSTGGSWLNKLTLVGLADAFDKALDPLKSETWQKFLRDTAGQSAAEKNRYALEHDFGPGVFEALNGEDVPVTVIPEVPEDAPASIAEQVGVVKIPASLSVVGAPAGGAGGGGNNVAMEKANGIWSVPYDGYLARLHKYERVMPAREVSSRNFSSNLYVESMIMNNGADAAGLAASMAAAQRRTMTGFGS